MASASWGSLGRRVHDLFVPRSDQTARDFDARPDLGEVIDTVDDIYESYVERPQLFDRWMKSLRFYMGYHFATYDYYAHRVKSLPYDPRRVRITVNLTLDAMRTYTSKVTKSDPSMIVVAGSRDTADYNAARTGQQFVDWFWDQDEMSDTLIDVASMMGLYGDCFAHVDWDEDEGEGGDIVVDPMPPMEATPDWAARNLKECRYFMRSRMMDRKWTESRWSGPPIAKGRATQRTPPRGLFEAFSPESYPTIGAASASNKRETVLVHWYYERPSDKRPNGLRSIIADGDLREFGDADLLPNGDIPFAKFQDINVPGAFWGRATAEEIVELNHGYNMARSAIHQSARNAAGVKVLMPIGSPGFDSRYFTNAPGIEKIPIHQGRAPQIEVLRGAGSEVYRELDLFIREIEAVSGQHEVSRSSQPPTGVTAALAIQQLLEMDDTRMATAYKSFALGLKRISKMILHIAQTRYTSNRMLMILGQDGIPDYIDFSGAKLMGNYDVRVQIGSALAQNKTVKQDLLMKLGEGGYIEKHEVVRRLDLGDIAGAFDKSQLDARRARLENQYMADGRHVAVHDYDNDDVHSDEHDAWRKSPDFLTQSDDVVMMVADHINEHGAMKRLKAAGIKVPQGMSASEVEAATMAPPSSLPSQEPAEPEGPPNVGAPAPEEPPTASAGETVQ